MLSERERQQWAGIEERLRRDPWFAVHARRFRTRRMKRWVIGAGVMAVLGWWLFTPLPALWRNLAGSLVLATVLTVGLGLGLAGWIDGRHGADVRYSLHRTTTSMRRVLTFIWRRR